MQNPAMPDPLLYNALEVSPTARPAVIRAAYRCLAQEYHPDRNPGDAEAATRMAQINHAYSVLIDPTRRARYDQSLAVRATERRGAAQPSNAVHARSGNDTQNLRPFAFRPL